MPEATDVDHHGKPADSTSLIKALGSWDTLAIGFGAMIGFGWVVLTGGWLESAGTMGAVLAFAAGGVIMALVGLTYSELVAAMPLAGGEHNYVIRGMGARWAFICSWAITGGYITIVAFEAVALPRTALYLFPGLKSIKLWEIAGSEVYLSWALVGAGAALILTVLNIMGIKLASAAQTFAVVFLLIVGLLLVTGSFVGGETGNLQPLFNGGVSGFVAVLVVVPFLFVGFDVIPQSAEEVKIPARQVGKLVVVSVIMAAIWYIMVVLTTASSMDVKELAGADLATADGMTALWGTEVMGKVLVAGGIAGIVTSWNSFLIGASRLIFAMGRSQMLPAWFGRLHPKFRTPTNALLFIGALSVAAPFFGEAMLGWLVDSGSPSIVIAYFLVAVSFLLLRRREPAMDRPLRVGGRGNGGLFIGALAAVLCLGLTSLYLPGMPASLDAAPWILFGLWWVAGAAFFFRIPGGIKPGPEAEEELARKLAARASSR
ncbi:MAG TPA: APC family permease [Arthrobacter sp.]|nr:APC family permease [Arthrobacter sp.]